MVLPQSDLHGLFVDFGLFFNFREQVLMLENNAFELPSAYYLASIDKLSNHDVH